VPALKFRHNIVLAFTTPQGWISIILEVALLELNTLNLFYEASSILSSVNEECKKVLNLNFLIIILFQTKFIAYCLIKLENYKY
jgi:hypothetical protein